MYPASAAFKAAIVTDHIAIAKAEVWNQDQKLATIDIKDGSVKVDSKSAFRRTCEVSLVTDRTTANLVPDNDFDTLSPFGNELRLYRGVQYSDGTQEYVPLGVFIITDVNVSDNNEGVEIKLAGEDRALRISRNKWREPYQLVDGPLETAIRDLLEDRYADVQTNFPTTNVTINQVILGAENENDPWKDAVEICELVGYDLFFDVNGIAVMRQFPTLSGAVVSAVYVENDNTIVTSVDRLISSKDTFNGVIYTIEGSEVETPIRVEAWDEDTTSPTYRYGVFGEAPTFITTSLISTEAEAISAAKALLERYIGAQENISWNSLVDPTLDVNDVVYIRALGAKVDRVLIIDSVDIPLDVTSTLSAQARVVRVVDANEVVSIGSE